MRIRLSVKPVPQECRQQPTPTAPTPERKMTLAEAHRIAQLASYQASRSRLRHKQRRAIAPLNDLKKF
jgi:hypothetical protein